MGHSRFIPEPWELRHVADPKNPKKSSAALFYKGENRGGMEKADEEWCGIENGKYAWGYADGFLRACMLFTDSPQTAAAMVRMLIDKEDKRAPRLEPYW